MWFLVEGRACAKASSEEEEKPRSIRNPEVFKELKEVQKLERLWGGGRVSWDEVRQWHGHIYTTTCKIDS